MVFVEQLQIVGVVLAEKPMFVEISTRGIRNLPFCLEISGIQCSFVVIVRAFQTCPQREAADTRSLDGEDALEAVTESTPPVHPQVCSI